MLGLHMLQLGGLALHQGQVAEMATGEGKTLVATLPAYVNALTGAAGRASWKGFQCVWAWHQARQALCRVPVAAPPRTCGAAPCCRRVLSQEWKWSDECGAGRGVHIVTVNDYLAKRDAEW